MKITTKRFFYTGQEDIRFTYDINVSKTGTFYTYLPQMAVDNLDSYGLPLPVSKSGKRGYFEATTMEGLENTIQAFIEECTSRELARTEDVIEYQLTIGARYCKNYGDPYDPTLYPNGSGLQDNYRWIEGSKDADGNMFSVYARPRTLMTYRYASGKETTESFPIDPNDYPANSAVNFLNALVNNPNIHAPIRLLPCTETNANFLASAIKSIWYLNEVFGQYIKDDQIEKMLDTQPVTILTTVYYGNN